MAEIACPVCGHLNPEGFVFCGRCGSPLAAPSGQWYPTEERKVVTILFVDLSDFTILGGTLDPEATRTLVGRFFAAAREEIRRLGGSVEKFIGDAVMAVFGLPAAHEDDPARAVEAALAVRRRLDVLNESFHAEFGLTVSIHVGINTGEVLAAAGPAEGRDFLITGDAVNIAARLYELARPDQILVGERTYRFGRRFFSFRPAGRLPMKGRDQPLAAWEVVGPLPAAAARLAADLVGRTEELTRLHAVYVGTIAMQRPHIVVVTGQPGIGKSRLVAEFRESLTGSEPSPVFWTGRCLPRDEAITYLPLAEILKQECGIIDADSPEAAREKVAAAVAMVGAGDVADALAHTIGLDVPGSSVALLDPRAVGQELVRAWRVFFEAHARTGPLAVIFEDLQWAGDPLLELIEGITAGITEAPLLVLGTARPDLIERRRRWGVNDETRTILRLDPLSRPESDRLLDHLLPPGILPAPLRAVIVARAEGNPFFIGEMVRMLADDGVIVPEEGRWRLGPAPNEITIPDTIQAVIAARIDHLPLAQKAVVQQAAVIGRTFWLGALRALAGDVDVGDAVEALERKEFIQEGRQTSLLGEREYSFKHVLIHEVAYGSLPRGARGRLHRAVGEWLEHAGSSRLSETVDLLAHHFKEAAMLTGTEESRRRATAYLRQAAASAFRRYALDQAITYAQAALALGEAEYRPAVEELLGDALFIAGRSAEAEDRYRQALQDYARPLDQARMHRKLVPTLGVGLRADLAAEEVVSAERLLEVEPDRAEQAAVLIWKGRLAHHRMAYAQAIDAFTRAGQVLEEIADRSGLAWCQCFLANSLMHLGQYGEALSLAQQAGGIARDIRHPLLMALAYGVLQEVRLLRGEYEAALREEETDLAAAAAGDAEVNSRVLRIRGSVLHRRGHLADAATALRRALEVGEPERGKAFASAALAMVFADLDRPEEATEGVRQARQVAAATHHPELTIRSEIAALHVETVLGRPAASLDRCEAALRQWPTSRLLTVQALAAIGAARGDRDDVRATEEAAQTCHEMAAHDGAVYERLLARHLLGRAEMGRARWARSIALLTEASEGFSRLGARLEWGRALLRLAEAHAGAGNEGEARRTLGSARAVLAECGAAADWRRGEAIGTRFGIQAIP